MALDWFLEKAEQLLYFLLKRRKAEARVAETRKVIIQALGQLMNINEQMADTHDLFVIFRRHLDGLPSLNTVRSREEIINALLALRLLREDSLGRLCFDYFNAVFDAYTADCASMDRRLNAWDPFGERYLSKNTKMNAFYGIRKQYEPLLKNQIEALISEFQNGAYDDQIREYIKNNLL